MNSKSPKESSGEGTTTASSKLSEIFKSVDAIKNNTARIAKQQNASYKWNMQHHSNIKKIIEKINEITTALNGTNGSRIGVIEINEDSSLIPSPSKNAGDHMQLDTHDKGAEPHLAHRQNFNDFVVTRGAKLTLRELIESMDEIAFNELREETIYNLLPILGTETDTNGKVFAITFLSLTAEKFPNMVSDQRFKKMPLAILQAIDQIEQEDLGNHPDLRQQIAFLKKQAMTGLAR